MYRDCVTKNYETNVFRRANMLITNTTLGDILGVHPQICNFPATKLLFKKLQPKQQ